MSKLRDLLDRVDTYLRIQAEVYAPFQLQGQPTDLLHSDSTKSNTSINGTVTYTPSSTVPLQVNYLEAWIKEGYPFPQIVTQSPLFDELRACNDLADLEDICSRADMLKTELPNTRLVFGKGNPSADLMIIGEAPGADEDEQGEPFVGRSGQLLTNILSAIKVNREDIYIANIVKHRPPDNATPTPEQRAIGLPFLLKQLELINPKLLLCLGRTSALALINQNLPLADMRSKAFPFGPVCELYVTYHPAALLRDPKYKRPTWDDVRLIRTRYDALGCTPILDPMES